MSNVQPSYALLPASYPKTVGGMCYAIIGLTLIGLEQPLVTSQSQAGKARHAIPACKCRQAIPAYSCPITGQGSQLWYPNMHSADKLSQHTFAQCQVREARHIIPAFSHITKWPITSQERQTRYASMHSADKLFQHALQNIHCIKEAAKAQNSGWADTAK